MTEQSLKEQAMEIANAIPADELMELNAHFKKAFDSFIDTQKALNDAGVSPTAVASALAASYVSLVAAIACATDQPANTVIDKCQEALTTLDQFVEMAYERMSQVRAEKAQ
jgi:hypothetical protein